MDIPKLEGIVSAIEEESRRPSPSHNNLARLLALFIRALIEEMTVTKRAEPTVELTVSQPEEPAPVAQPEEPKPKVQKHKKAKR